MKKTKFVAIILLLVSIVYNVITNNSFSLPSNKVNASSDVKIYFIDVGQADSILITSNDGNMLIDAGNNDDGDMIVNYIKSLGVDKFSYVVCTHPHEDHIGGMDDVIDSFEIDNFYMSDNITTTKTFEDVLDELDNNNLEYTVPLIGSTFNIGNIIFEVLSIKNSGDLNDSSIVLRMDYYNNSALFMGDASSSVERSILSKNIDVDILKVGHHGSEYSTDDTFLRKVSPKYAIISVGKDNLYNHPSDSVINKLKNIITYRTDRDGTIEVILDGNNYKFNKIK